MGGDVGSIVCVFRRRRPARVTLQGSYAPIMLEGTKYILTVTIVKRHYTILEQLRKERAKKH